MSEYILVLNTVPNEKEAQRLSEALVKERLAACVTISATCQSLYWWQGKVSKEKEYVLFIKTQADLFPELEKKIQEIHSYEVPELIALPILKGSKKYLDWIAEETKIVHKRCNSTGE